MKTRRLLTLLIVILVILSCSIFVAANGEEPIDFDTVDWCNFDTKGLDSDLLFKWMGSAQLPALFRAYGYLDGAYSMMWGIEITERIKNDFAGFIDVLAQESTEKQEKIVDHITSGNCHEIYAEEGYRFRYLVYSVKVSGSKQQQVKKLFEDAVAKYWGESRDYETYPDPDSINWDTFQYKNINISSNSAQFSYFMAIAPLNVLFRGLGHVDGAAATCWSYEISYRMNNDFAGFIAALSQEDAEKQQRIANTLSAIIYNENDDQIKKDEFPDMVYSVKVSGSKQQYTLGLFKDEVEKYWGIPRTGDRFPVAETALCIVSLSLICLLTLDHRRRKYN